ncbi:MAG: gliding motility protein GldM [Chitinophagales bacterium]|nr:gliding motility protein GldM [Chitinophagales bacterium]
MSIPKEPRQLMINLMYLVLTAMLALNVSAEILNAFNLVNKGISDSNDILQDKNDRTLKAIERIALTDNRPTTQQILVNATAAKSISDDFVNYVEALKDTIKVLADGPSEDDSTKLKTEGEMEKTSHFLIKEGKGDELYTKIKEAHDKFLALVGNDPTIQVPLNVTEIPEDAGKKTWSEYNFDRVPAIAVVTILTKLQQDAKSAENSIIEKLAGNIYMDDIKIDKMAAKVVAPTSYVKSGNEYTADIYLGATSEAMKPKVFLGSFTSAVKRDPKDPSGESFAEIEGVDMPLSGAREIEVVGGMGKIRESASGTRQFQGVIQVKHPNKEGEFKYYPFEFGYETFQVGGAVISPTAMNVLYVGVDNPVKISVPGYTSDKVTASGCNIKKVNGEEYMANPTETGLQTITVSVNTAEGGKTDKAEFRVRRIPDPYAYMSTSKGGTLKVGEFKATSRIDAKNPDFVFQIPYTVAGFEMVYAPKQGGVVSDYSNSGTFSSLMEDIKKKARAGDTIVLPVVKVRMPDGTTRSVSTSFKLI